MTQLDIKFHSRLYVLCSCKAPIYLNPKLRGMNWKAQEKNHTYEYYCNQKKEKGIRDRKNAYKISMIKWIIIITKFPFYEQLC